MAAIPQIPVVNGREYSWASVHVNLFGRLLEGITAISYGETLDWQNLYGRGKDPVAEGHGNREFTSSITLHKKEVEAIQAQLAPGQSITELPAFDIEVNYLNDENVPVRHVLQRCRFRENKRELEQGEAGITVEIELKISGIKWA